MRAALRREQLLWVLLLGAADRIDMNDVNEMKNLK